MYFDLSLVRFPPSGLSDKLFRLLLELKFRLFFGFPRAFPARISDFNIIGFDLDFRISIGLLFVYKR